MSAASPAPSAAAASPEPPALVEVVGVLEELAADSTMPRNVRRGAQATIEELGRRSTAVDVRIAGAVYRLDDLANDPNLPLHGRTALWSLISRLESLA